MSSTAPTTAVPTIAGTNCPVVSVFNGGMLTFFKKYRFHIFLTTLLSSVIYSLPQIDG